MHINFDQREGNKIRAALDPRPRARPRSHPRRSPERPPEVGADITPVNCDRSETQCVGISELFGLLLSEHTRSLKVHAEYRVRAFSEPRNGRVADVVASADLDQAPPPPPFALTLLCVDGSELELPTEPDASGLRSLAAFIGPGPDQLPLELSEAAQDRQHQPPVWGGGVGPSIGQGPEPCPSLPYRIEDVEEVPSRSARSLSSRVTSSTSPGPRASDCLRQRLPVSDRAANLLSEYLLRSCRRSAACCASSVCPSVLTLAYPTIIFRSSILRMTSAQQKPLWIRPSRLVHHLKVLHSACRRTLPGANARRSASPPLISSSRCSTR